MAMNRDTRDEITLAGGGPRLRNLKILFLLLLIPGTLVFLIGALYQGDLRVWQGYLVNLLFWSGFSQAGIVISALFYTTNSQWGKNIQHIMEGLAFFSPVAFFLFLILYVGGSIIFPWVKEPVPEKGFWLNIIHLFVRQNFNMTVINVLNLVFLYFSFRPDLGALLEGGKLRDGWFEKRITSGWRGFEEENARRWKVLRWLSPVLLFVYVVVYSMIGFDMVMSLDPHWYSTLFGAYYFMTNLYLGIAGITLVSILLYYGLRLEEYITASHFRDLGLMIFVFCLIAFDFFWSQYLVIWYGNIPEETSFVVRRIQEARWLPLSLAVVSAYFGLPFIILLSRGVKERPLLLFPLALLVFAAAWLERYLLVVPTLWHGKGAPPIGFPELAITVAFLAGFGRVYLVFIERLPIIPCDAIRISSPRVREVRPKKTVDFFRRTV